MVNHRPTWTNTRSSAYYIPARQSPTDSGMVNTYRFLFSLPYGRSAKIVDYILCLSFFHPRLSQGRVAEQAEPKENLKGYQAKASAQIS
jgi:hypothetical protein